MTTVGTHNETFREDWVQRTLQLIPAGFRILDAGAGELRFKKYCAHLKYVAQDFGEYDGKGDSAGLQTGTWDQSGVDLICDICSVPEADGSFDAVMCIEVLEHLPDPISAIREFSRLIRSGGYLVMSAPFASLTHFAPYHYYSGFNTYFYTKYLGDNDFTDIEISHNGNFFESIAQELRRIDQVVNRYTDMRISRLEKYGIDFVLKMLEKFSRRDNGSYGMLCHGYHVFCRKR